MDIRQLRALVAVAENGTFSAAADALGTVQSNVSSHIAKLERELGATLVDRTGGRLTEEGRAVLDRARRIETEMAAMVADLASLTHEVTGDVRAGMIGTTARWLVPGIVEAMARLHPRVQMVIVDATSTSLEPQLAQGRLDLAVVNLPLATAGLAATVLFEEDLKLFLPPGSPMAGAERVQLADLVDTELLLPPRGTALGDLLEAAAAAAGIRLRPRAYIDGLRLIASLVASGAGAAILPATAASAGLREASRPVTVVGLPRRQVGVALPRRGLPTAPARAYLDVLGALVAASVSPEMGVYPPATAAAPPGDGGGTYQDGSPSIPGTSVNRRTGPPPTAMT